MLGRAKGGHYTAKCDCETGTTRSPEELNGNPNDECDICYAKSGKDPSKRWK